jgi:hypothetical protein
MQSFFNGFKRKLMHTIEDHPNDLHFYISVCNKMAVYERTVKMGATVRPSNKMQERGILTASKISNFCTEQSLDLYFSSVHSRLPPVASGPISFPHINL